MDLDSIDDLDENLYKAIVIATYEKKFGDRYRLPHKDFEDLMKLPVSELENVISQMIASI
ncbi:MAG: hypothetical protein ACRCR5_01590 [Lactococcus garvieae]